VCVCAFELRCSIAARFSRPVCVREKERERDRERERERERENEQER